MRSPKKNETSPERQNPEGYCITDMQGTILHRISPVKSEYTLQLQHFAALEQFISTTWRIDRLQAILTEVVFTHIEQEYGVWAFEKEDLGDFAQLLRFLGKCHMQPTPTELENVLRR